MKKIEAKIIADSINTHGDRITTFLLTYPRFIHAELMTHRVFSRNSASSRAIPFKKMLKMVEEDPFIPIAWQKDHKGMQGTEYFTIEDDKQLLTSGKYYSTLDKLEERWLTARDKAVQFATDLNAIGLTKQLCNRLLEPFMWHTVIVTSTEYDNFFSLRCPKNEIYAGPEDTEEYRCFGHSWKDLMKSNNGLAGDFDTDDVVERLLWSKSGAEIHIQALAEAMWDSMNESTPKKLQAGEWHIPFGDRFILTMNENYDGFITADDMKLESEKLIKVSTARCARLSYMTFDGEIDYEKDLKLHDTLLKSHHASPFEHCCRVLTEEEYNILGKMILHPKNGYVFENGWVDNFRGFISYRRILNI